MSQADLELLITPGSASSYGLTLRFRQSSAGQDKNWSGAWRLYAAALLAREHDPAAYGEQLAAQLLAGAGARAFLDQALAVAASGRTPLHLRLFISGEAEALHSLRWETLRLPGSAAPLAAGEWVRFSRYLDSKDWRPVQAPERDDLRALVVVASPDVAGTTLAEVRVDDELQRARAGLGEIPSVALATRGQVTLAHLMAGLREGCDILYLVAHGMIVDGDSYVLLEQTDGGCAWTSGQELVAQLGELAQPPSLTVLVSCQSAGSGQQDGGALAALGPRLAAAGVRGVLAMQGNVSMATTAAFMPVFLRELRRDGQVDRAMAVARGAVRERPDWWMPVLFSRLEDGRLFRLPQAADDPLAGLPPLPALDLPDKPYRYLDWYRREDAPVFFGRGREIRALYERVTAPDGEPIVLLYGQSGVGKSSLLAAGLLPRLEGSHAIRYARRDQALGLLGTLGVALGVDPDADLATAWRDLETTDGKPLLAVLDQVEEVFTRPNSERAGELSEFLDALAGLLGDPARRPQGRLLMGFRKEWLAEINQRLAEHSLPRGEVFLERLGRAGIAEVVAGPRSRPRLQKRYGLAVSDGLPDLIAGDLLADRGSPVAPMLAILLADMWEAAKAKSYERPVFDEDLYHEFRSRGLSLDDFLGRQLGALYEGQPAAVDSGLALDVLAYHTTLLGTAEQRTLADLTETYRHRQDALPALVQGCRDLYLLVDPAQNEPRRSPASRLTHDTLAPHVRRRFDESDAPGQRARRILESRVSAKEGGELPDDGQDLAPLGDADLAVVVAGRDGMRALLAREEALVAVSEADRACRLEEQTRLVKEREDARQRELEQAQKLAETERLRAEDAETAARRSRAGELTLYARMELTDNTDPSGSLALILARDAVFATWKTDREKSGFVTSNADKALRDAVDAAPPHRMTLPRSRHSSSVHSATYSPDGQFIVTASWDQTARIWSAATGGPVRTLCGHSGPVRSAAYSPDGHFIVTASWDDTARIWNAATGDSVRTLGGYSFPVSSAAYSPDGRFIVTASWDRTARIWDATTGDLVCTLSGHTGELRSAAYSPDGQFVVTASWDRTAVIWDAATGAPVRTLKSHGAEVCSAVYSPDGRFIVTASDDMTARIWDAATGAPVRTFSGHNGPVKWAAYSPDGQFIVTASEDMTTCIWDAVTGHTVLTLSGRGFGFQSAAYSPDGKFIVTASSDTHIIVWDAATGDPVRTRSVNSFQVKSAAYSPDGQFIVTASADATARIWDAATGDPVRTFSGHTGPVKWAAYSPDGQFIVTASEDMTTRIWDAVTGHTVLTLSGRGFGVESAVYSPDGKSIVTASSDMTAQIWNAATGDLVHTLSGHSALVRSAAYSPDGRFIVTASWDRTARIWDATTGDLVRVLSGHSGPVWSAIYSPDSQFIVTASEDMTARIWTAATGDPVRTLGGHSGPVLWAAYSPDGRFIVTAHADGTARIWDTATGEPDRTLSGHNGPVWSAVYSLDGQCIVTASSDRTARIWGAAKRNSVRTLSGHSANINSAAYSPDGRFIVTASWDRTARIWDATTGDLVRTLSGHTGELRSAAYSPDGQFVVTASTDRTVRIWNAATGDPVRTLRGHIGPVWSAAYSPDGWFIVTASKDETARVWNATTGDPMCTLVGHRGPVWSAAYSPDGRLIITASEDMTARIWDAATGDPVRTLNGHGAGVYSAVYGFDCISPYQAPTRRCGQFIVTASWDRTTRIWDAATGQGVCTLSGHSAGVYSAAFGPGCTSSPGAPGKECKQFIVTASHDRTARIWDATTGDSVRTLGHSGPVCSAAYSPDGQFIVTASDDRTARIWIAGVDALLAEAARLIQRDPPLLTPEERQRYGLE